MRFPLFSRFVEKSTTVQAAPRAAQPCIIEPLENRELLSATLKVISLTPVVKPTPKPVVHQAKTPKVVKVVVKPKPKPAAKTSSKTTLSNSSGGEKHIDSGVSQFT